MADYWYPPKRNNHVSRHVTDKLLPVTVDHVIEHHRNRTRSTDRTHYFLEPARKETFIARFYRGSKFKSTTAVQCVNLLDHERRDGNFGSCARPPA